VATTGDNPTTDLELDRLAWNLPTPRAADSEREDDWTPWPFGAHRDEDEEVLSEPNDGR
jgi:hypothetical protein